MLAPVAINTLAPLIRERKQEGMIDKEDALGEDLPQESGWTTPTQYKPWTNLGTGRESGNWLGIMIS